MGDWTPSASISIYFWLINLFSGIDPLAEKIQEITEKADDKTSEILNTGMSAVQLFIVSILLFILNQLFTLKVKNSIVQLLEEYKKNILAKSEDNNTGNPPGKEPANLIIDQGPTPNGGSNVTSANTESVKTVKISKVKPPKVVRIACVRLKQIMKKLKF